MTEEVLDGHKVRALFIEVSGEGMAEGMGRDRKAPLQTIKLSLDVEASGKLDNVGIRLCAWKEPSSWFPMGFPVAGEDVQGAGGEHSVSLGSVLRAADENPEILALNVFVP